MPKAMKVSATPTVDPIQESAAATMPVDPPAPDPANDPGAWPILSEVPSTEFGAFVDRLLVAQREARTNLRYVSVVSGMVSQLEDLASVPGALRRDYQTSRRIDATKNTPAKRTTYNPSSLLDALTGKTPLTASQLFRSKRAD